MALQFMYITNNPSVAGIADVAGVDRIVVDLESLGKSERQRLMNTVQNNHTLEDVGRIRGAVSQGKLMVRCNRLHRGVKEYCDSEEEINTAIELGADVIMLPYFKTVREVDRFLEIVDGRAIAFPLLETPEAVDLLDEILQLQGIDEIHIGLNDLSLGYGKRFLFEVLADGTVDRICEKIRDKGIPFGFGGIASLGKGKVPAEMVIREHYRLGSERVILSRSFCDINLIKDVDQKLGDIERLFNEGVRNIREFEKVCASADNDELEVNHENLKEAVKQVVEEMQRK